MTQTSEQSRLTKLETRIGTLERNRVKDAARIRTLEKIEDTRNTPLWRRVWFVMKGYRLNHLGVWYHASWNRDGWGY